MASCTWGPGVRLAFVDNGTARESLSHTPETRDPDVFLALLPSNKAAARGKTLFREEEPRHQKSLSRPAYQRGRKGPHERGYDEKSIQARRRGKPFRKSFFFAWKNIPSKSKKSNIGVLTCGPWFLPWTMVLWTTWTRGRPATLGESASRNLITQYS